MRYALIKDGSVINVIELDDPDGVAYVPPDGCILVQSDAADPGDLWDGEVISKPNPPAQVVTVEDVKVERARRLSLGFDFNFQDERGVHHIGTTPEDMIGWQQVTNIAQSLINLGQGGHTINISTDTGMTQVTATEWQQVQLAGADDLQPVWQASFLLEAMDPIPADFANDSYWSAP